MSKDFSIIFKFISFITLFYNVIEISASDSLLCCSNFPKGTCPSISRSLPPDLKSLLPKSLLPRAASYDNLGAQCTYFNDIESVTKLITEMDYGLLISCFPGFENLDGCPDTQEALLMSIIKNIPSGISYANCNGYYKGHSDKTIFIWGNKEKVSDFFRTKVSPIYHQESIMVVKKGTAYLYNCNMKQKKGRQFDYFTLSVEEPPKDGSYTTFDLRNGGKIYLQFISTDEIKQEVNNNFSKFLKGCNTLYKLGAFTLSDLSQVFGGHTENESSEEGASSYQGILGIKFCFNDENFMQ